VNYLPLSVMMRLGTRKQETSPSMNLIADLADIVRMGSTSLHLENLSMAA
jgi:hypothetical protein